MTGGLLIKSGNPAATIDAGLLLEVLGTASGRTIHAQDELRSSGSLVVEGTATAGDFTCNNCLSAGDLATGSVAAAEVLDDNLDWADFADFMTLDSSTRVNVGSNDFQFNHDGTGDLKITDNNVSTHIFQDDGSIVFNDSGVSTADVTMKGDTNASLFVLDASADRIGIGTATPDTALEIIGTASGRTLHAQDQLRSSGSLVVDGSSVVLGHSSFSTCTALETVSGVLTCGTDADTSQNLFETVAVSGQSNVVADSATDTLTLAAGSNVTITTNAGSDSVTINATDTNTTYSAGQGITQNGTVFSLSSSFSGSALEIVGTASGRVLHAQDQLRSSGSLIVDGNALFSPNGTVTVTARREATSEFASFVLNSAGTDQWSFQMRNDGTNDFFLRDNANGRTAMRVIQATNLVNFPTTASGRTLHAQDVLRSSGTLIVEGAAAFQGAVTIVAGNLSDDSILEPDLSADNSPSDGDILTYDTTGTNFNWITPHAGTDVTADLEEETHAAEHNQGGADTLTVENLASSCTDAQVVGGDGSGGTECQADQNTTYSAGQGITQNGTVFRLSSSFSGSALEIIGTASGRILHAQDELRSSGSLLVDGNVYFNALACSGTNGGALTVVNGQVVCSDDDSGGGGSTSTGALQATFDGRYVNTAGDTMTGALTILKTAGTSTGNTLVVDTKGLVYDATNKRVGVGTATPKSTLDVVGTVSGAIVRASSQLRSSGTLTVDGRTTFKNYVFLGDDAGDTLTIAGRIDSNLIPNANIYDLGTTALRWDNIYTDNTMFMGDNGDDGSLSYNVANDYFALDALSDSAVELVVGNGKVGIKTTAPETELEVVGTASGRTIHAQDSLRSSGSLLVDGGTVNISNEANPSGTPKITLTNQTATTTIDPSIQFQFGTTPGNKFVMGTDTSNGNYFKISSGSALGTNDRLIINNRGDVLGGSDNVCWGPESNNNNPSIAFCKKAGAHPQFVHGNADSLDFVMSDSSNALPSNTYTTQLSILTTGTLDVKNNLIALKANDTNHGLIYDSTVDGPLFRGWAGFRWGTSTNGSVERMRLNTTGLGIGTTNITQKLTVAGAISGATLTTQGDATIGNGVIKQFKFDTATGALFMNWQSNSSFSHRIGYDPPGVIFNDLLNEDVDFLVNDRLGPAFFVDATLPGIGIGTNTPAVGFDVDDSIVSGFRGLTFFQKDVTVGADSQYEDSTRSVLRVSAVNDANNDGVARLSFADAGDDIWYFDYTEPTDGFTLSNLTGGLLLTFSGNKLALSGALLTESGAKIDGSTLVVQAGNNRVGVGTASPEAALEVIGTASGNALTVSSLKNCDTIDTDANGVLSCGADGGGSGGAFTSTGSLQTLFDGRYVNDGGDTMTGGLLIQLAAAGVTPATIDSGLLLEVAGTASGRTIHAQDQLRSSGALTVDGNVVLKAVPGNSGTIGLGDSNSDTVTIPGFIGSSLRPNASTYDLASAVLRWNSLYMDNTLFMGTSGDDGSIAYNTTSDYFSFDALSDAAVELVVGNGKVGIKTTAPETELEVIGTASGRILHAQDLLRSSGALAVEGTATATDFACADCLDFAELEDTLDLDAATQVNLGSAAFQIDLDGTGDLQILDGGSVNHLFSDDGSVQFNVLNQAAGDFIVWGQSLGYALAVDVSAERVGVGTFVPDAKLEVIGTASGSSLHASDQLRSSGSLIVDGATVVLGHSNFATCADLETAANVLTCGTDDDVPESGDFAAAGDLDADGTITDGVIDKADFSVSTDFGEISTDGSSNLTIDADVIGQSEVSDDALDFAELQDALDVDAPTTVTLGSNGLKIIASSTGEFEVVGTSSGTNVHASTQLRSSGTLVVEGNSAIQGVLTLSTALSVANGGTGLSSLPTRSVVLSAGGAKPSTLSGSVLKALNFSTNNVDLYAQAFGGTGSIKNAQWTATMPDNYDGGTMTAVFYWTTPTTVGNAKWQIQCTALGDGDALDASWGTAQSATDAAQATANRVLVSSATPAITCAGTPAGGKVLQFRAFRDPKDASDTMAQTGNLLSVKLEYGTSSWTD